MVPSVIPDDERVWVPQAENVWFRPLFLNTVTGGWCNMLRVRRSGVLSRHIHPGAVFGYVVKGTWRYLEHDWIATEGSYVFEPPGETHTLVVPEDVGRAGTFLARAVMAAIEAAGGVEKTGLQKRIDQRRLEARAQFVLEVGPRLRAVFDDAGAARQRP